jgi:hypothetical protein
LFDAELLLYIDVVSVLLELLEEGELALLEP